MSQDSKSIPNFEEWKRSQAAASSKRPALLWGAARSGHRHQGEDFGGATGEPVAPDADGEVIFAGPNGNMGNTVTVRHSDGFLSRYGHLNKITTSKGAKVTQGEELGEVGSTGNAKGPHVHYETFTPENLPVNPRTSPHRQPLIGRANRIAPVQQPQSDRTSGLTPIPTFDQFVQQQAKPASPPAPVAGPMAPAVEQPNARVSPPAATPDVAEVAGTAPPATVTSTTPAPVVPRRPMPAFQNQVQEEKFRQWYGGIAKERGLNPNSDDPRHQYDYRAAFLHDAGPDAQSGHWPSQFKLAGHPNRYVDGKDTITGQPDTRDPAVKAGDSRRRGVPTPKPEDVIVQQAVRNPDKLQADLLWHYGRNALDDFQTLSNADKRKMILYATQQAARDEVKKSHGAVLTEDEDYQAKMRGRIAGLKSRPAPTKAAAGGPITGMGEVRAFEGRELEAQRIVKEELANSENSLSLRERLVARGITLESADQIATEFAPQPQQRGPVTFTPQQKELLGKLRFDEEDQRRIAEGGYPKGVTPPKNTHKDQVRAQLTKNLRLVVADELNLKSRVKEGMGTTGVVEGASNDAPAIREFDTNSPEVQQEAAMRVEAMMLNPNITNMPLRSFEPKTLSGWLDDFKRASLGDKAREVARALPFVGQGVQIGEALRVYSLAKKLEAGKATDSEKRELAYFQVESTREGSKQYQVASIVAQLPAFAGELALTGGLYSAGKKTTARILGRVTENAIAEELMARAPAFLERQGVQDLAGLTSKVGQSLVGSAVQTPIARAGSITAGTLQRMTPEFQFEDGKLTGAKTKDGKPLSAALARSVISEYIEVATEHSGGIFEAMGQLGSTKALKRGFATLTKLPEGTPDELVALLKKGGWHGTVGEMFEERVGDVAHWLNKDQDSPFSPPGQLAVEAVAFSVPELALRLVPGASRAIRLATHGRGQNTTEAHQQLTAAMQEVQQVWERGTDGDGKPLDPLSRAVVKEAWSTLLSQYNAGRFSEARPEFITRGLTAATSTTPAETAATSMTPAETAATATEQQPPALTKRERAAQAQEERRRVNEAARLAKNGTGNTPTQVETAPGSVTATGGTDLAPPDTTTPPAAPTEPASETSAPPKVEATPNDAPATVTIGTAGDTLDQKAHDAAHSPTNDRPIPSDAQHEAGNYKKGHIRVAGMDLSVENPEGSERSGVDNSGKPWSIKMASHYGYVRRTEGADGEHVDAYIRPGIESDYSGPVFVVNQTKGNGHFDEHKAMIGWATEAEARAAYVANYTQGWNRVHSIAHFESPEQFKSWLSEGDTTAPAVRHATPLAHAVELAKAGKDTADVVKTLQADHSLGEQAARNLDERARQSLGPKTGTPQVPPPTEAAARTPREVIEAAGYKYLGEQQRPKGKSPGQMFSVGDDTLMMTDDVTPESVAAYVAQHKAKKTATAPATKPESSSEGRSPAQAGESLAPTGKEEENNARGQETAKDKRAERLPEVRESRSPKSPPVAGKKTRVKIPGTDRAYQASYSVREADDVVSSHNPFNFQPEPDYHYVNDRRYDREAQYQTQVIARSKSGGAEAFDPAYVVNNSPTAESGPPIIDADGNVLGGNSRSMIIKRVYGGDDKGAERSYRDALIEQASIFGIDPAQVRDMRQPVLVREIADDQLLDNAGIQKAITELNVPSTTPLTQEEQSAAAAGQISDEAAQFITDMIEVEGDDATIAAVMDRKGVAIVNRLIEDGIFSAGDRNRLLKDGKPTAEAKTRVESLLVGSIYRDLAQMQATPAGVRRNVERIVVPMRRVTGTDWDISEDVKNAVDAVIEARATGMGQDFEKLRNQSSMVRKPFTDREIDLAKILVMGPVKTAKRFRGYAHDFAEAQLGNSLFGAPSTQADSADFHLGEREAQGVLQHRVFHGTPHDVDRFSIKKIGTGEGAQAYGHGLYFTDSKDVAEHYRNVLKADKGAGSFFRVFAGGKAIVPETNWEQDLLRSLEINAEVSRYSGIAPVAEKVVSEAKRKLENWAFSNADKERVRQKEAILDRWLAAGLEFRENKGNTYEVELKPQQDEYLLWDKPLSEQSAKVQNALQSSGLFTIPSSDELKLRAAAINKIQQRIEGLEQQAQALEQNRELPKDGDRFASSGTMYIGKRLYLTGKVYEAKARKSDGILTWRKVEEFGGTGSTRSKTFLSELKAEATYPWSDDANHGVEVQPQLSKETRTEKEQIEERELPKAHKELAQVSGDRGKELYKSLERDKKSAQVASEFLHSFGIRGIKYLTGSSRSTGEGDFNYVIFSDDDIEIKSALEKRVPREQLGFAQQGLVAQDTRVSASLPTSLLQRQASSLAQRVFGSTSSGRPLLDTIRERGDSSIRTIADVLEKDAGRLSEAEGQDFARALDKLATLRGTNTPVSDFLNQGSFFGKELSDEQEWLLSAMDAPAKRATKFITNFVNRLASKTFTREDIERATEPDTANQSALFHTAWHGSAQTFDKFETGKIGTGQGAQSFGWGLYFAGKKQVAQHYRAEMAEKDFIRKVRESYDEEFSADDAETELQAHPELNATEKRLLATLKDEDWLGFDYPHQAVQAVLRNPSSFDLAPATRKAVDEFGRLYQVELAPKEDEYLLWDKPLSDQSAKVQAAIDRADPSHNLAKSTNGQQAYRYFTDFSGSQKETSRVLYAVGIRGIKYLDQESRHQGTGTYNYVVFSDDDVSITALHKNRIAAMRELAHPDVKTENLLGNLAQTNRNQTFYANAHTMELLRRVNQSISGQYSDPSDGMYIDRDVLELYVGRLRSVGKAYRDRKKEAGKLITELTTASRESLRSGGSGGVAIIGIFPGDAPLKLRQVIQHERGHEASDSGAQGKVFARRVNVATVAADPVWTRIFTTLTEKFGYADHNPRLIEEGQAWLVSRQGAEALGLNPDEAAQALRVYFQSFAESNGTESLKAWRKIRPAAAKVRDDVYRKLQTPQTLSTRARGGDERAQSDTNGDVRQRRPGGDESDAGQVLQRRPARRGESQPDSAEFDPADETSELAQLFDSRPTRREAFDKNFSTPDDEDDDARASSQLATGSPDPLISDDDPALVHAMAVAGNAQFVTDVTPAPGFEKAKISARQVIKSFESVLLKQGRPTPIRVGKMGGHRDARGFYKPREEIIRLKVANNIPTAAHETGHAIQKIIYGGTRASNLTVPGAVKTELTALGIKLYGTRKPAGGYATEGFAEFMRHYLTTDDAATEAPLTLDHFENRVLPLHPVLAASLQAARKKVDTYRRQGAQNRARANTGGRPTLRERMDRIVDAIRSSPTKMVDEFTPLLRLANAVEALHGPLPTAENPFTAASYLRGIASARVAYMVEDAMVDFAGNPVGKPLADAAAIVKGKQREFTTYLWAKRAQERWNKTKTVTAADGTTSVVADPKDPGMSLEDADAIVAQLETPQFELAAQQVYDWNKSVLQYVKEAAPGLAPAIDKILATSDFYVPLARVFDAEEVKKSKRESAGGNPLKRMKGSGRAIKDIFPQMIANAERMIAQAHRKFVVDAIVRLAGMEGVGHLIEEVPKNLIPHSASTEEIIDRLEKAGVDVDLSKANLDELMTFFSPEFFPKGQDPIVPFMRDGVMRWYYVHPDLYNTLMGLDIYRLPKILDLIFGVPTRVFRAGTTGLRAAFALFTNPARDFQTFVMQTQSHKNPALLAAYWTRSMAAAFSPLRAIGRRDEYLETFYRLGAQLGQPLGVDMAITHKTAKRLFRGKVINTVTSPLNLLQELLSLPESASRVAEIRSLADEVGWKPGQLMTIDQAMQLGLAAKRVTVDFSAAGSVSKVINQVAPFFNAGIQGGRSFARVMRDNPRRSVLRGLMLITIPTLLLWWKIKDEDWYADMSWRDKFMNWHIPAGQQIIEIPRAFEWGNMFAVVPEAIFDSWHRKDPEGVKAAMGHIYETTVPDVLPVVARNAKEQWQNRIEFFDRPIVPRAELDLPPGEQRSPYTSKVAVWLGKRFPDTISPRRVDALIRGLGGGVAPDVLNIIGLGGQRGTREREPSDLPVIGRAFRRGGKQGLGGKAEDDFYNELNRVRSRAASSDRPESNDQREYRLVLEDSYTAISVLREVQQDIPSLAGRQQVSQVTREIAHTAKDRSLTAEQRVAKLDKIFGRYPGLTGKVEEKVLQKKDEAREERSNQPKGRERFDLPGSGSQRAVGGGPPMPRPPTP